MKKNITVKKPQIKMQALLFEISGTIRGVLLLLIWPVLLCSTHGLAGKALAMDAEDWVIQKVCVDASGNVVPADPYFCPKGDTLRPLAVGERMPYYRHDQPSQPGNPNGFQRHDSYPILDLQGDQLIMNSRIPMRGASENLDQLPHYDVNLIDNNWLTGSETRDGTGFSQAFFGADRVPYNGWVYFPTNIFANPETPASGSAYVPISGVAWEQSGMPAPGDSPQYYITNCLTTWTFKRNFAFGGVGGCPVKYMDAIVSTHGFESTAKFLQQGHIEVFYFTQLYGETRWETWTPVQQHVPTIEPGACLGPTRMTYRGVEFNLTDCRDWSAVTVNTAPRLPPVIPIPDCNLLQNWHFDHRAIAPWTGSALAWLMRQSEAPLDIADATNAGKGVCYLTIRRSGASANQSIWQDIPITQFTDGGSYAFGSTLRSESGTGIIDIVFMQVDKTGNPIPGTESKIAASVGGDIPGVTENGQQVTIAESVVLSSRFFMGVAAIKLNPLAAAVRFALTPETDGAFDIVDTWVVAR
jgi:hypothetical protein